MRQLTQHLLRLLLPLMVLALACASPGIPNPYRAPTLIPLNRATNTAPPALTPIPFIIRPTNTGAPTLTTVPSSTITSTSTRAANTSTPNVPCQIIVRTPPANAPTASENGKALPKQVDPHVEICAAASTIKVGESVTVMAQAVDIGLPFFFVRVKDGSGEFQQLAQITYDNKTQDVKEVSRFLEFVSGTGSLNQATIVLRGRAAGTASIFVNATGEIHYGFPGPATFGGGGSPTITIVVTP